MNRLSLANVIGFIIGVIVLVAFLDKEGRFLRFLKGSSNEEVIMESPRPPADAIDETDVKVAPLSSPAPARIGSSPTPTQTVESKFAVPEELRKLPQFSDISFWMDDEWELPEEKRHPIYGGANFLISEVSLRTKLFQLKSGEGILLQPKVDSSLDKLLRAYAAAGKFRFEFGRNFAKADVRKHTETYCDLELTKGKQTDELHYEKIERGLLIESTRVVSDKKGFSGVELKGATKTSKLLGQIVSITCYIRDVKGAQLYQKLELIHLFYNLGSKGRLVPITKK